MSSSLNVSLIPLDRILEAASVLSWDDLMPAGPDGIIQVEYRGNQHALEYLKVWASTKRGHWNLVCDYVPSSTHPSELTFAKGYKSETFDDMLSFIIERQAMFAGSMSHTSSATLVQIRTPSDIDRRTAESVLRQSLSEYDFATMLPRTEPQLPRAPAPGAGEDTASDQAQEAA